MASSALAPSTEEEGRTGHHETSRPPRPSPPATASSRAGGSKGEQKAPTTDTNGARIWPRHARRDHLRPALKQPREPPARPAQQALPNFFLLLLRLAGPAGRAAWLGARRMWQRQHARCSLVQPRRASSAEPSKPWVLQEPGQARRRPRRALLPPALGSGHAARGTPTAG